MDLLLKNGNARPIYRIVTAQLTVPLSPHRQLSRDRSSLHLASLGFAALILILLFLGCRSPAPAAAPPSRANGPATTTDAAIENLYASRSLPAELQRVVVLPVYFEDYQDTAHGYIDELWFQAIQRQNRFETIAVSRATLSSWSGREQWASTAPLPPHLRARIASQYAPDAILLCDLTRLDSYQPLEIGLRAKLFAWNENEFLWGVDGVWTQRPDGSLETNPGWLGALFKNSPKNSEMNLDLTAISPRYFYYHLVESVAPTLPNR